MDGMELGKGWDSIKTNVRGECVKGETSEPENKAKAASFTLKAFTDYHSLAKSLSASGSAKGGI